MFAFVASCCSLLLLLLRLLLLLLSVIIDASLRARLVNFYKSTYEISFCCSFTYRTKHNSFALSFDQPLRLNNSNSNSCCHITVVVVVVGLLSRGC